MKHIDTQIIHGGVSPTDQNQGLVSPLHQTATYVFETAEQGQKRFAQEEEGFIYTRLGNPTTHLLETKMALLEEAEAGAATATGMAAISAAIMSRVAQGDHIVASKALYGCSYALLSHMLTRYGVQVTFVDFTDPVKILKTIKPNTKVFFFETPINPHMDVIDIKAVVEIAQRHDIFTICDNTFMTPVLQKPITIGINMVVHSATKYLNGHGDVVAGIICGTEQDISLIKTTTLKDIGGTISPHDAWLILRGLKTLHLRVERHCQSAEQVAQFLDKHELVKTVHYPGLPSHKGYRFVNTQMKAAGGVIAFEIDGGTPSCQRFLNQLKLGKIAVSLGDAETLAQHPATMTHSPYSPEERLDAGITDSLIRVSIGLENVRDIIDDLDQALNQMQSVNITSQDTALFEV